MVKREYIKLNLKDLKAYEKNNKKHGANIDEIVKSIQANTYITPIVVDENYVILAGHGRKLAMDKLQIAEADILVVSGLSETQKRDFRIRDNKLTELSEWDFDNLNFELQELNIPELSALFNEVVVDEDYDEENEDEVPEVEGDIYVQEGDIFQLGDHKLMCGDSMNESNIIDLIDGIKKENTHCISDPPYGIAYDPEKHGMIKNDDKILDYTALAKKYTAGFFCMWTGYQVVDKWIQIIQGTFEKITNMIIWHKGGGGMGDCQRSLSQDFEILLVNHRNNFLQGGYRGNTIRMYNKEEKNDFIKKGKKEDMQNILQKEVDGVCLWKVKKDNTIGYMHPTQKPVEINERVLENFTQIGDNVLDLFGGSGSNLLACEKLNRKCYMMELDPKYVTVIIKRFYEVTGGKKQIKCINRDLDITLITND